MPRSINQDEQEKRRKLKYLSLALLASVGVPTLGYFIFDQFIIQIFDLGFPHDHPQFNSVFEIQGAFLALCAALLLIQFSPHLGLDRVAQPWFVVSLVSSAGLDLYHSALTQSENFVFWHRAAVILGGLTFGGVWLSPWFEKWKGHQRYWPPLIAPIIFALVMLLTTNLPETVSGSKYTTFTRGLSIVGSLGYLAAAGWLWRRIYRDEESNTDWFFFAYAILLGYRPLLFQLAGFKSPVWWWSHALTFLGHLFLFLVVVSRAASVVGELFRRSFFLGQILENVPSMIFVKEAKDLRFVMFNRAGEDLLGLKSSELIGKNDFDLFPEDQARFFIEKDREVLRQRGLLDIPEEILDTASGTRWLHTRKVPILDAHGEPSYLLGISDDVTEYRKVQRELELERSLAVQRAKMATLGEMSSGIAHEINNPLAIIKGKLEFLLARLQMKNLTDEKLEEDLNKINKTCDRIGQIVSGLRAFSRHSHQDPMQLTSVRSIIDDTLALCSERFRHRGIDLSVHGELDLPVLCRPGQISQVLMNLLSNAYDAVEGQVPSWVEVSVDRFEDRLRICVSDSGPMIPEETVSRMMEPFFTTKEVGRGTGLGLSISRGLIEDHGGTLTYDRSMGHTRFIVDLPLPGKLQ